MVPQSFRARNIQLEAQAQLIDYVISHFLGAFSPKLAEHLAGKLCFLELVNNSVKINYSPPQSGGTPYCLLLNCFDLR